MRVRVPSCAAQTDKLLIYISLGVLQAIFVIVPASLVTPLWPVLLARVLS